eukprot:gene2573-3535_t
MNRIVVLCLVFLITFYQTTALVCNSKCNGGTVPCDTGNNIVVVAQLFNGVSSRYYPYCLNVDRVHELRINGSYSFVSTAPAIQKDSYVKLWVEMATSTNTSESFKGFIFDSTAQNMVSPYFSSFISMTAGYFDQTVNVTNNINFETVCTLSACDLDYSKGCLASTHCSAPVASVTDKDVKIMIGFQGTDKSARFFTSANSLPHKYRFYSFSNVYNDVVNIIKP